jgi:acyl-coenzyme A thioesterase PaaI-like protein
MLKNEHYRKLENMMHFAPIVKLLGVRVEISHGQADITLPVKQNLFHATGALHGAMYFLALDNAAFFAVNSTRTQYFAESILYDAENREIARGSSVFVKGKVKLTPEIGYK